MTMRDLNDAQVAAMLRSLAEDGPDPSVVGQRALARYRGATQGSRNQIQRAIAAAVLLVLVIPTVLYVAPAAGLVLANGSPGGAILHSVGLDEVADRITASHDTSTQNGVRLSVVGAYGDSARTVMLIELPPGFRIASASLTDQFMQSYELKSMVQEVDTGDAGLIFAGLRGPSSILGARLTLTVDRLVADPAGLFVPGTWQLHTVLLQHRAQKVVSQEKSFLVGDAQVRIGAITAIPSGLQVRVTFPGASASDVLSLIQDGSPKGRPAVVFQLRGASEAFPPFLEDYVQSSEGPAFDCTWFVKPDRYSLVVDYRGQIAELQFDLTAL
jgi:hypothetical protein